LEQGRIVMGKKKKGKKQPGVFVDEISSGARPIEGVGTAIATFVGFVSATPFRVFVTSAVAAAAVAFAVRSRARRRT
jgi:phage tail sheath protein FI